MRCPWSSLVGLVGLAVAACGEPASGGAGAPAAVRVFAASSLAAPFEAVARAFEAAHPGLTVELHFAGSPALVLQLREGAACDVFASADETNMQRVVDAGVAAGVPVPFAGNRLAIVVRAGNPQRVEGLADLARADLKVALCGPEVPAGKYARDALRKAGVTVVSRSDEANVRALVAKVHLGELDAGIVYATDTRLAGVTGIALPAEHDVVASYPITVIKSGENHDGGSSFLAFVRGAVGQAILREHGFGPP